MKKKNISQIIITTLIFIVVFSSLGCTSKDDESGFDPNSNFETILENAKGQTVSFYGWGGNPDLNNWLDNVVAPEVKEKYDITLNRVPMDIDQILSKLAGEKQAETSKGSIDLIWINGENFYSTKENDLLFGPISNYLPNYKKYIDKDAYYATTDFGYPINGFEVPYSKAQMVLINDKAKTPETPKNAKQLMEFAKKYKGKVTYPAPPDFTGSAFVRNIICDIVGAEGFENLKADKEAVREYISPAISYFKELNQYLWNQGKSFPATISQLDNMYSDGELVMTMSYESYQIALNIEKGLYTETSRSFILDKGTIGNTNYMAIAKNSPNKEGALVVINEILSPKMQSTKYEDCKLLPAIEYDLLTEKDKETFDNIKIGKGIISQDQLLSKQIPEIPAKFVPIIEEIWLEEVPSK